MITILQILIVLALIGFIYGKYTNSNFYKRRFLNAVRCEMLPDIISANKGVIQTFKCLSIWAANAKNYPEIMNDRELRKMVLYFEKEKSVYTSLERANEKPMYAGRFDYLYGNLKIATWDIGRTLDCIPRDCPKCIDENFNAALYFYNNNVCPYVRKVNALVPKYNEVRTAQGMENVVLSGTLEKIKIP